MIMLEYFSALMKGPKTSIHPAIVDYANSAKRAATTADPDEKINLDSNSNVQVKVMVTKREQNCKRQRVRPIKS